MVEGHQLTTLVCPNFPILKICGCPNFNPCDWTSPKEIFGENTGLYPVKMTVLLSGRTNRLQETYIVGILSLLKPCTVRRGHETYSNQQLLVKGLTPSELCRISPICITCQRACPLPSCWKRIKLAANSLTFKSLLGKYMSCSTIKPTRWPVHQAKTQISLGIRPTWSVFTVLSMGS